MGVRWSYVRGHYRKDGSYVKGHYRENTCIGWHLYKSPASKNEVEYREDEEEWTFKNHTLPMILVIIVLLLILYFRI